MAAKVNITNLKREIARQSKGAIEPKLQPLLNAEFEAQKKLLLREFDEHPVSKEILAGPTLNNSSFVDTQKGGNLYSFLGFKAGLRPVEDLRAFLFTAINKGRVTKEIKGQKITYSMEVRVPTKTEINRRTALLFWTNRGWVDMIEKGVGNFGRYLFNKAGLKKSRSGTALQAKKDIRNEDFRGTAYISELIANLIARLK